MIFDDWVCWVFLPVFHDKLHIQHSASLQCPSALLASPPASGQTLKPQNQSPKLIPEIEHMDFCISPKTERNRKSFAPTAIDLLILIQIADELFKTYEFPSGIKKKKKRFLSLVL